jgi:hypothetical protein
MDTETFAKHFTLRHEDGLAGQHELPEDLSPGAEEAYRIFHNRLHQTRKYAELKHEHSPDPPEAGIERALSNLQDAGGKGWYEIAGLDGRVRFRDNGTILVRIDGEVTRCDSVEDATDVLLDQTPGE